MREAKSAALRRFCEAAELARLAGPAAAAREGEGAAAPSQPTELLAARVEAGVEAGVCLSTGAATVTRDELRAALRAELRRREERGEPCMPVHVFDSEAKAADLAAELEAELPDLADLAAGMPLPR